jgi:hypothetical protein
MPLNPEILSLGTTSRGDGLSGVLKVIGDFAQNCIDDAVTNLNAQGKNDSGNLSDSIKIHQLKFMGNVYTLKIKVDAPASKYFDFVNEGVSGTKTKYPTRFSFKNNKVSPEFARSIFKWMIRHSIKDIKYKKYSTISAQENKNRSVAKLRDGGMSTAYAVAVNIKKKGIKPSHFWDKAFDKNYQKLADDVAAAFKKDVVFILQDVGRG